MMSVNCKQCWQTRLPSRAWNPSLKIYVRMLDMLEKLLANQEKVDEP